jgi:hypothetical protein
MLRRRPVLVASEPIDTAGVLDQQSQLFVLDDTSATVHADPRTGTVGILGRLGRSYKVGACAAGLMFVLSSGLAVGWGRPSNVSSRLTRQASQQSEHRAPANAFVRPSGRTLFRPTGAASTRTAGGRRSPVLASGSRAALTPPSGHRGQRCTSACGRKCDPLDIALQSCGSALVRVTALHMLKPLGKHLQAGSADAVARAPPEWFALWGGDALRSAHGADEW